MMIALCILTYKRPDSLERLLESIKFLVFKQREKPLLHIIVVDNDVQKSGEAVCRAFTHPDINLSYVVEMQQGIPLARNTALENLPTDTDFVCFLDDDEWTSPTWLEELLIIQQTSGASCVLAPVLPVYPDDAPRWIIQGRFFDRRDYADGVSLNYAASNNVLIKADFIREHHLRFDNRLRFNGGSDTLFFRQAIDKGMKIVWAAKAFVSEEVPHSRLTFKWLLRRQYRFGNTLAICDRLHTPHKITQPKRLIKGVGRSALGALQLIPLSLIKGRAGAAHAILNIAKGAGMVAGVFGFAFEEYAPQKVAQDRV